MSTRHGVLWLGLWACVQCASRCGPQTHFEHPKGRIELSGAPINCSWSIAVPERSVLLLRLEMLQLGSNEDPPEKNCLSISSPDKRLSYAQLCSDLVPYDKLAVPSNVLLITMEVTSESHMGLSYTSYVTDCPAHQLQCFNARVFPKPAANTCADGQLACDTHCQLGSAKCGTSCYDVDRQRCDGVLDCAGGEDELGCRPTECPGQVSCPQGPQCLQPGQICDGHQDCTGGFDEAYCLGFACNAPNCSKEALDLEGLEVTYIVAIVFGVMLLLFIYLMCRCMLRRRNLQDLLDSPLDVPLPPFRGPDDGAGSDELPYSDADFRPGGDIFESFAANVEKIKDKRKTQDGVTLVRPAEGQDALTKYFKGVRPALSEELAALATIKISRDNCYGLRKAKSEERPMTRLLFIDRQDDGSSGSDTEAPKPPLHAKSDTSYLGRQYGRVNLHV